MNASEHETRADGGQPLVGAGDTSVGTTPGGGAFVARILISGVVVAIVSAVIASGSADRFRVTENVESGAKYRGTELVVGRATQNAVVAYSLIGACLSLSLGVTASCLMGRFSIPRVVTASMVGIALGGVLPAASAYWLTPVYLDRMGTADVTLSMLVHLGIWTAVGAATGTAFGIGSGTRKGLGRSVVGGITGAGVATLVFDVGGVFFPFARTERPLSEEAGTRLVAAVVLSVFVLCGAVVVATQEPRADSDKV